MQYTSHLTEAGLTSDQASLYETLVQNGPLPASRAARLAGVSRTLSYKVLDDLEKIKLVTKKDPENGSSIFTAEHPNKLQELVDQKEESAQRAKIAMDGVLSSIISDYNKVTGKPGVRILEGKNGIQKALNETLEAHEMIYTYADIDTIQKYVGDINKQYMKNRIKRGIKKRILAQDTPEIREDAKKLQSEYTEIRLIPKHDAPKFFTAMEIYDGKISYLTFKNGLIATIIEDEAVYTMHRYLFEHAWHTAESL